jgi:3-phenylpropionate/cinnamic acid dioxygenase small subunit
VNQWKEAARDVLEREAVYLDEQRWDDWLALYTPDCEYWAPTWRTEDEMAADPQRELSHIYYASRAGLEDRIVRIRSGKSPASSPMRRTAHLLGPLLLEKESSSDDVLNVRVTWTTHVFDPRHRTQFTFFGASDVKLVQADGWKIKRKKIRVQNDLFPAVVDVYCF